MAPFHLQERLIISAYCQINIFLSYNLEPRIRRRQSNDTHGLLDKPPCGHNSHPRDARSIDINYSSPIRQQEWHNTTLVKSPFTCFANADRYATITNQDL